jgi:hypothetical protein
MQSGVRIKIRSAFDRTFVERVLRAVPCAVQRPNVGRCFRSVESAAAVAPACRNPRHTCTKGIRAARGRRASHIDRCTTPGKTWTRALQRPPASVVVSQTQTRYSRAKNKSEKMMRLPCATFFRIKVGCCSMVPVLASSGALPGHLQFSEHLFQQRGRLGGGIFADLLFFRS